MGLVKGRVLQYLLGNSFDTVSKTDMYEAVAGKQPDLENLMNLNEGQRQVVAMARNAPAGTLLVHGGPGTGKTYLMVEMCKPFFASDEHHRLLVCSC
jgi:type II secretory ATPase GspE/PulE/Tfp pilus assembly ATPase PilB-like protein